MTNGDQHTVTHARTHSCTQMARSEKISKPKKKKPKSKIRKQDVKWIEYVHCSENAAGDDGIILLSWLKLGTTQDNNIGMNFILYLLSAPKWKYCFLCVRVSRVIYLRLNGSRVSSIRTDVSSCVCVCAQTKHIRTNTDSLTFCETNFFQSVPERYVVLNSFVNLLAWKSLTRCKQWILSTCAYFSLTFEDDEKKNTSNFNANRLSLILKRIGCVQHLFPCVDFFFFSYTAPSFSPVCGQWDLRALRYLFSVLLFLSQLRQHKHARTFVFFFFFVHVSIKRIVSSFFVSLCFEFPFRTVKFPSGPQNVRSRSADAMKPKKKRKNIFFLPNVCFKCTARWPPHERWIRSK